MSALNMSESSSEYSENDDFSDFEVENEDADDNSDHGEGNCCITIPYPYSEEPIASKTWVEEYRKKKEQSSQLEKELTDWLNGTISISEWCKCGRCEIYNLQNISECYCCSELDGCRDSLESDLVAEDLDGVSPNCIVEHPGFNPVCLEKWSLRLAAGKYKKKNKETYKRTGSEERFLRSVAYREFTRLVYGLLGKKRYPLPACAYSAIRKKFKSQEEENTGFEMEGPQD